MSLRRPERRASGSSIVHLVAASLVLVSGCGGASAGKGTETVSLVPPAGTARALDVVPGEGGPARPRKPVEWHAMAEEEAVRRLAKVNGRPVVVRFFASWCAACLELDKTMATGSVLTELERFDAVSIDATDDEDPDVKRLQAKYGVIGLPTVVVVDGAGKEAARILDAVDAPTLVGKLRAVGPR